MWISKKELQELKDRVKELEENRIKTIGIQKAGRTSWNTPFDYEHVPILDVLRFIVDKVGIQADVSEATTKYVELIQKKGPN